MWVEVLVPGVGESVSEGMLTRWLKRSGEFVEKDEPLAELETDKATVEVPASASGLLETLVAEGSVVKVRSSIARVDSAATRPPGAPESTSVRVAPPAAQPATSVSRASVAPSAPEPRPTRPVVPSGPDSDRNGPAVRRIVAEAGLDVSGLEGSGRGGRLTKGDALARVSEQRQEPPSPVEIREEPHAPQGGRQERRKPMSMIRRRIAERLLAAQQNAAILTTFNEVDMSAVQQLREQYKADFEKRYGVKLGFMGFFMKAVVEALQQHPEVNARIEGTDIIYQDYCDIGVAVSTEKGLMVPVVRNAERLSLAACETALASFARKARENKITVDDLAGGTFSITNGGVFGSLLSTPILNPPQSAILGMHKIQMRPVCTADGKIEARPMMYVALSYDHRIIDGRDAVGFLVRVKQGIEDPSRLLIGV